MDLTLVGPNSEASMILSLSRHTGGHAPLEVPCSLTQDSGRYSQPLCTALKGSGQGLGFLLPGDMEVPHARGINFEQEVLVI